MGMGEGGDANLCVMDCSVGCAKLAKDFGIVVVAMAFSRHARACRKHLRVLVLAGRKTWMAGTNPAMTEN